MTRYLVDISDELLAHRPWTGQPASWRIVEVGAPTASGSLGARRCVVEDDDAPAELEGQLVEPVLQRDVLTGVVTIMRRVIVG